MKKTLSVWTAFMIVYFLMGSVICYARLGETEKESAKRYGKPVGADYVLVEGATHKTYEFEGWKMAVAFMGGEACCIEYSKLRDPEVKRVVIIQPGDIDSLLKAEAGGGTWTKQEPEESSNPFKALGRLMENTEKWTNSNDSTAELRQNKIILRFESPAAKVKHTAPQKMDKF